MRVKICNAFAHSPFAPKWIIDNGLRDTVFTVRDIIEFNTAGLHETPYDWRHYGGLLALYRLCRFVRFEILKDPVTPRKPFPMPAKVLFQQGDLIMQAIDKILEGAVPVPVEQQPDGGIPLGHGHVLHRDAKLFRHGETLIIADDDSAQG